MTEHSLWRFSRALHRAINERQYADIESLIDEDVDWAIFGPIDMFPFFGARRGRPAVVEVIKQIAENVQVHRFERESVMLAEEAAGLLLLAYVMQRLPIERQLRRGVFVAMTLFSLSGGFGVNYTFFRFAAPPAIFLFSLRGRKLAVAAPLLLLGQLVTLGISPEMGFGFGSGVVGYGLLRALRREFRWLVVLPVPLVGFGLFLLVAGRGYLHVLSLFSGGAYSLIVEPQIFVLLYLASLIWLAPAVTSASRAPPSLATSESRTVTSLLT